MKKRIAGTSKFDITDEFQSLVNLTDNLSVNPNLTRYTRNFNPWGIDFETVDKDLRKIFSNYVSSKRNVFIELVKKRPGTILFNISSKSLGYCATLHEVFAQIKKHVEDLNQFNTPNSKRDPILKLIMNESLEEEFFKICRNWAINYDSLDLTTYRQAKEVTPYIKVHKVFPDEESSKLKIFNDLNKLIKISEDDVRLITPEEPVTDFHSTVNFENLFINAQIDQEDSSESTAQCHLVNIQDTPIGDSALTEINVSADKIQANSSFLVSKNISYTTIECPGGKLVLSCDGDEVAAKLFHSRVSNRDIEVFLVYGVKPDTSFYRIVKNLGRSIYNSTCLPGKRPPTPPSSRSTVHSTQISEFTIALSRNNTLRLTEQDLENHKKLETHVINQIEFINKNKGYSLQNQVVDLLPELRLYLDTSQLTHKQKCDFLQNMFDSKKTLDEGGINKFKFTRSRYLTQQFILDVKTYLTKNHKLFVGSLEKEHIENKQNLHIDGDDGILEFRLDDQLNVLYDSIKDQPFGGTYYKYDTKTQPQPTLYKVCKGEKKEEVNLPKPALQDS